MLTLQICILCVISFKFKITLKSLLVGCVNVITSILYLCWENISIKNSTDTGLFLNTFKLYLNIF